MQQPPEIVAGSRSAPPQPETKPGLIPQKTHHGPGPSVGYRSSATAATGRLRGEQGRSCASDRGPSDAITRRVRPQCARLHAASPSHARRANLEEAAELLARDPPARAPRAGSSRTTRTGSRRRQSGGSTPPRSAVAAGARPGPRRTPDDTDPGWSWLFQPFPAAGALLVLERLQDVQPGGSPGRDHGRKDSDDDRRDDEVDELEPWDREDDPFATQRLRNQCGQEDPDDQPESRPSTP